MCRIAIYLGDGIAPNLVRLLSGISKLAADRFDFVVVGTDIDPADLPEGYELHSVPNIDADRGLTEFLATYRRIDKYLETTQDMPDALWQLTAPHFHAVPALLVGRRYGLPVATRIPGNKFDEYREQTALSDTAKTFVLNNVLLRLLRYSLLVVVLSDYNRMQLRSRGVPERKIRLLRQPLDTETFAPVDDEHAATLKKQLGFDTDAHSVMFVGRLSELKGMDTLETAVARFEGNEAYEFHFVGAGPYETTFARYDNTVCHGFVDPDDLHRYYKAADVYVHPSYTEEQGISWTMIEAAATGLPVLAREVENAAEVASAVFSKPDELEAWLAEPDDWSPATYPTAWSLDHLESKYNAFFDDLVDKSN